MKFGNAVDILSLITKRKIENGFGLEIQQLFYYRMLLAKNFGYDDNVQAGFEFDNWAHQSIK